jgi:hypothetical protein
MNRLTADIVAGPGGLMTDEVGVVTGELTLISGYADGAYVLLVRYRGAEDWYTVTGANLPLASPHDVGSMHALAVALLHRAPE